MNTLSEQGRVFLLTPRYTMQTHTCEFVTPKHPDKLCDRIADSILDAYLAQDAASRVAVEVMGGHGSVYITGEVTSSGAVDIPATVARVVGNGYAVHTNIAQQSSEIAGGVDMGGAGDQGIMTGYACNETDSRMPREYELARTLCQQLYEKYPVDGKVQVTCNGDRVGTIVATFQGTDSAELEDVTRSLISADEYLINPAGEWSTGGFDADAGMSGRKIMIDNYGPRVPAGGGAFSGKDATKVDRSAAYMARRIALDYLKAREAGEVLVKLAYAIGRKEPAMQAVIVDGTEERITDYNSTPRGIIEYLQLTESGFAETAAWGHFGRAFAWG